MLLIQARFLSGRFHATPWGHHVNEGLVEWPPSPWRLLRALLSTGFTRLGWKAVPENGVALIELLASRPPRYHLPPATTSHTRHYMPLYGGKTTRVIDAFASVAGPLVFEFDVNPEPGILALLDCLLSSVPYLGRAESTVELTRIDAVPAGHSTCEHGDTAPSVGHEGIALLAPEDAVVFVTWRESVVRDALASLSARASAKEKPPTKKEIAKVNSSVPRSIVEALLATTPGLQHEGWSMPPGTRWLSYWRAHGALEARPRAVSPSARRWGRTDTALFALSSDTVRADVLPAMRDALYRMEALHQALVLKSAHNRPDGPSPCFTGSVKGDRIPGHRHATLIPLTLGKRAGRIDHVLVHAPMGFDSNPSDGALRALGAVRKILDQRPARRLRRVGRNGRSERLREGRPGRAPVESVLQLDAVRTAAPSQGEGKGHSPGSGASRARDARAAGRISHRAAGGKTPMGGPRRTAADGTPVAAVPWIRSPPVNETASHRYWIVAETRVRS